jgi:hypothetical protein
MVQAEQELLALGEGAVPILSSLFSGEAGNDFGVPYRQLGLSLRCAIEVARRLGPAAKPLEEYLREEARRGDSVAAMALASLGTLERETVDVLAQLLTSGGLDASYEAARALILCGETSSTPVVNALASSARAATLIAQVSPSCFKDPETRSGAGQNT